MLFRKVGKIFITCMILRFCNSKRKSIGYFCINTPGRRILRIYYFKWRWYWSKQNDYVIEMMLAFDGKETKKDWKRLREHIGNVSVMPRSTTI